MPQTPIVNRGALVRTGARLAVVASIVAGSSTAVWWGLKNMPAPKAGPTKQVATGTAPATNPSAGQFATASLNDAPLFPAVSSSTLPPTTSSQTAASAPPPTSSYLPPANDLPGRYGGRSAAAFAMPGSPAGDDAASTARTQPPASTPPADPLMPATASPSSTTYNTGAETSPAPQPPAYLPPTTSAAPVDVAAAPPTDPAPASSAFGSPASLAPPAADVAGAYANRFNQPPQASPPAAATSLAPGTLPGTAKVNPYAAGTSDVQPLATSRRQPEAALAPNPLAATESNRKLSAATPGERQLEGPQQPAILLEKVSPSEIQVGKPATFELYVRNAGQVAAQNVVVTDHVPAGTQLQSARPQPQQSADGGLAWNLGTMQPGEETQIVLEVIPQSEGEIGSTALATFTAVATSRSLCTRPQLTIEHTAPPKVLIGESLTVGITISNPGTGPATGVSIEEDVPAGLQHAAGAQLQYEVGTLRPGESKRLELTLKAQQAGLVQNTILARGDANLAAQHSIQIEVVAPQLSVEVEGPKVKYLERPATYTLQVNNPGTATAHDVQLVAALPRGMKFVAADSQGQYDAVQHAVYWSLAELPPSKAGPVKLTTLPIEPGEQRLQVQAQAEMGLTAAGEQIVQVEQSAELLHTVKDKDEVIEVGSETSYEIRVVNSGTKTATNVRIVAIMPQGLAAIGSDGPTRAAGDATQVVFEPLPRLNPQEEVIFRVQVQGKQPGDHVVRVQLSTDERATPVTREESTHVYQDR